MDDTRIQQEINKYKKFKKVDGATYRKVNQFLRKRTYIYCAGMGACPIMYRFQTSGGAEMTFIGNVYRNLFRLWKIRIHHRLSTRQQFI